MSQGQAQEFEKIVSPGAPCDCIVAGTLFPPSNCANLRAARILAAISNTRLRPSSTRKILACSLFVRRNDKPAILGRDWPAVGVFRGV